MSIFIFHLFPKKLAIFENTAGTLEIAALPNFQIPTAAAFSPRPIDLAALLILPAFKTQKCQITFKSLAKLTMPADPDVDGGAESAPYCTILLIIIDSVDSEETLENATRPKIDKIT